MLPPPVPTTSVEEAADWIEWQVWIHRISCSALDLIGEYSRGGGIDADDTIDMEARESLEIQTEDIFAELDRRRVAAGKGYPFLLGDGLVSFDGTSDAVVYLFLLTLSHFGTDGAPSVSCGAELFENVCLQAACSYLGGEGVRFGSPRRAPVPRGFQEALDKICSRSLLNEGGPARQARETARAKDGGLDILAWQHFPDRRPGKLVLMGQCTTGRSDINSKLAELDERAFQELFLGRPWESRPVRAFFFPWSHFDPANWCRWARLGGILFDRCRVAHHAQRRLPEDLRDRCHQWATAAALGE